MKTILLGDKNEVVGVELDDGKRVYARTVLSNATANVTFLKLLPEGTLTPEFEATIRSIDYTSPVCKINGKALECIHYFSCGRIICMCTFNICFILFSEIY